MPDVDPDLAEPEHILCDTSFVRVMELAGARPDVVGHWPPAVRERLEDAVLAITVFVLGEVRSGHIMRAWGEAKIEQAERVLSAYLVVPIDFDVLDRYVQLRARFHKKWGDNDMWIAATAMARDWPLVTCDLDFCRIKDEIDLIYLPRLPDSPVECP